MKFETFSFSLGLCVCVCYVNPHTHTHMPQKPRPRKSIPTLCACVFKLRTQVFFENLKKKEKRKDIHRLENFICLANFYNQLRTKDCRLFKKRYASKPFHYSFSKFRVLLSSRPIRSKKTHLQICKQIPHKIQRSRH